MPNAREADFVQLIADCQNRLYAYIATQVPDAHAVNDIRQDVNLTLWEKKNEFEWGTNFNAWAYRVAFFQILAYRRDKGRGRLIFCEELIGMLDEEVRGKAPEFEERSAALNVCLSELGEEQRWLINQRYALGLTLGDLAGVSGRRVGALGTAIYRIRNHLRKCITERVGGKLS
jgi:RNA polymerase sigma-70 factor (ECF subfamily)